MDTRLLSAFVRVAEHASFSRAAQALQISQPAISKRVAALEAQTGSALFDRVGRQVLLTEAGRTLLPYARRVLGELEDSRRALSALSSGVTGRLSVGISHHIGLHRLPPVLRDYVRRYPAVELDMHFVESEQGCAAVEHGSLELALVTLPDEGGTLRCMEVWPDPMRVVVSADHPLAAQSAVTAQDLSRFAVLLPDRQTFTCRLIDRALAAQGMTPRVLLTTHYLETIKTLVGIGLGWSVLPVTLIDAGLHAPPGLWQVERRLGAVWHPRRTRSNPAQALLELLTAVAR